MLDSVVDIYEPINSRATDGTLIKKWGYLASDCLGAGTWTDSLTWNDSLLWIDGPIESLICDVQPKSITDAQLKEWGLSTLTQDAKAVYDFSGSTNFKLTNRAIVDGGTIYQIKAINNWNVHQEYIFVPLQGS